MKAYLRLIHIILNFIFHIIFQFLRGNLFLNFFNGWANLHIIIKNLIFIKNIFYSEIVRLFCWKIFYFLRALFLNFRWNLGFLNIYVWFHLIFVILEKFVVVVFLFRLLINILLRSLFPFSERRLFLHFILNINKIIF